MMIPLLIDLSGFGNVFFYAATIQDAPPGSGRLRESAFCLWVAPTETE